MDMKETCFDGCVNALTAKFFLLDITPVLAKLKPTKWISRYTWIDFDVEILMVIRIAKW